MDDDGYEWKEVNGIHYWRIAGTSDSWTLWEEDSNYNQETSINDSVITGNVQHNKTVIQNDSDSIITAFLKGVNHNQGNEIVSSETIDYGSNDSYDAKQLRIVTEMKKENWGEAIKLSDQLLGKRNNIDDLEIISSTLQSKGLSLMKLEDYQGAHSALTEGIQLAKQCNLNFEMSESLLMYVETCLPEGYAVPTGSVSIKNEDIDFSSLSLRCAVEMKKENWSAALSVCEQILHHREKLALSPSDSHQILQSLTNKALILYNLDRSEEAIPVFTEAIEIGKLKGEDTSGNEAIRDNLKILEARRLKKNSEPETNRYSLPSSQSVSPKISDDLKKLQDWQEHCDKVKKHFGMRVRSLATKSFWVSLISFTITGPLTIFTNGELAYLLIPSFILLAFGFLIVLTNNKRQYKDGFVDGKPVLFCSWCGEWVKNGTFSNGPEKMNNHWENTGHTQEQVRAVANLRN